VQLDWHRFSLTVAHHWVILSRFSSDKPQSDECYLHNETFYQIFMTDAQLRRFTAEKLRARIVAYVLKCTDRPTVRGKVCHTIRYDTIRDALLTCAQKPT